MLTYSTCQESQSSSVVSQFKFTWQFGALAHQETLPPNANTTQEFSQCELKLLLETFEILSLVFCYSFANSHTMKSVVSAHSQSCVTIITNKTFHYSQEKPCVHQQSLPVCLPFRPSYTENTVVHQFLPVRNFCTMIKIQIFLITLSFEYQIHKDVQILIW